MAGVLTRRSASATTGVTQPGIQGSAQLSTLCTAQSGEEVELRCPQNQLVG